MYLVRGITASLFSTDFHKRIHNTVFREYGLDMAKHKSFSAEREFDNYARIINMVTVRASVLMEPINRRCF